MAKEETSNSGERDISLASHLLYQMIDEKYSTLLDESSDLMCIVDREGKFIYVNKKLADSLGFTKKEMLTMHMRDIIAPECRKAFAQKTREFLKTGKAKIHDFVLKTKYDGKIVGKMHSIAFYDNEGRYCGAKAIFNDQTKIMEIESLEKKYESMMEDGIDTLDYIIIILDKDFKIKWASSGVQKYFGLDKTQIVGEDMRELLKTKLRALIRQEEIFLKNVLSAYEANLSVENFECEIERVGSADHFIMEHWSYPITHGDLGGGRLEIYRDITARKRQEETLEYYYKKIHAIMEHAVEGMVELRVDNTIEFVNMSFLQMLGYSEIEMLNHSLSDFILPDDRMRLASVKLIRKAREISFLKKDGTLLHALVSSIPLVFGTHTPHALCFISDITERKMAEEKLKEANATLKALNDSLLDLSLRDVRTGVYNDRYLNERLSEEIKRARRYFRPFSLLMIDIDFFKAVNDAYGHGFGDIVLKDFTTLLKRSVRDTDIIVRAGGEEFVIFLSDTNTFGAFVVASKIIRAMEAAQLGDEKRKINLTVSIGIASFPEAGVADALALLDAADQAMYQSKAKGRNKITAFNKPVMEEAQTIIRSDDWTLYANARERLRNINSRNEESVLESMLPLVREAEKRAGYYPGHTDKILKDVDVLAKNFLTSGKEIQNLRRAALLCNLGLLSVPPEILSKKGPLNEDEMTWIREYPVHSSEMIRDISFLEPAEKDILYHHECFDGNGYPHGLSGEDIPMGARLICAAETYEALVSPRPYRPKAFSKKDALEILRQESARQLDPAVVAVFLAQLS